MKRDQKRMNILIMGLSCMGVMALLFMTGCGNGCGQVPHCGGTTLYDADLSYISLPMCGGCLTSRWGCSSCLWGENCVISTVSENHADNDYYTSLNCGELYYGNSCTGCGSEAYYVYNGISIGEENGERNLLCYYGATVDQKEYIYGYKGGACVCTGNEGPLEMEFVYLTELIEHIIQSD